MVKQLVSESPDDDTPTEFTGRSRSRYQDDAEAGISGEEGKRGRKIGFHAVDGDGPEGNEVGYPRGQRRGNITEIE